MRKLLTPSVWNWFDKNNPQNSHLTPLFIAHLNRGVFFGGGGLSDRKLSVVCCFSPCFHYIRKYIEVLCEFKSNLVHVRKILDWLVLCEYCFTLKYNLLIWGRHHYQWGAGCKNQTFVWRLSLPEWQDLSAVIRALGFCGLVRRPASIKSTWTCSNLDSHAIKSSLCSF